jgi:hypothetical protein
MAQLLAFEIGIEYTKGMKGARHWVFHRPAPAGRTMTRRAKP